MPSELQQTACYRWLCNQQSNDNVLFSVRKATETPNITWAEKQGSSVIQESETSSQYILCSNCRVIFRCLLIPVITSKIRRMKSRTEFPLLHLRVLSLVLNVCVDFTKFVLLQSSHVSDSSLNLYSTRLWPKSWPVFLHHY